MNYFKLSVIGSVIAISGCGGGSGDGSPSIVSPPTALAPTAAAASAPSNNASFAQMYTHGERLIAKYDTPSTAPTRPDQMPKNATATYKGVAGFAGDVDSDAEVMANVQVNANFANSTVNGRFDNFRTVDNQALPGTVSMATTAISDNIYKSNINGSLNVDGTAYAVTGQAVGAFANDGATATTGVVEGKLGAADFIGVYIAER